MPGLLDYVKGYQDGGSVDFDPYADTSQADMLAKLGITVDSDAMGLLPTYDPTGADMARNAYGLRTSGLADTLATARRGGTRSLLDLTQQSQQQQAGTGFAGGGAGARAMTNVRSDIISGFGDIESDIGRREDQAYLDLQQDIWGIQRGYESDLLSAIGDLDPEDWSFGGLPDDDDGDGDNQDCFRDCDEMYSSVGQREQCYDTCTGEDDYGDEEEDDSGTLEDTCNEQCAGFEYDSQQYNDCIDSCYSGVGDDDDDTGTQCPSGYSYINGECIKDALNPENQCPPGFSYINGECVRDLE